MLRNLNSARSAFIRALPKAVVEHWLGHVIAFCLGVYAYKIYAMFF